MEEDVTKEEAGRYAREEPKKAKVRRVILMARKRKKRKKR